MPADESGVFSGSLFRVVVSKEGLEDRGWVPADLTRLLVVRAGGSAVAGEKWLREIQDGWLVTLAPAEPLAPLTQHSVEFAQIPLTDFVTRKARGMGWARA